MPRSVCTIIGAGEGLGQALAARFAREGFDIALVSRTEAGSAAAFAAARAAGNAASVRYFAADAMINDGEIIRDLAVAGMGVAYLPDLLVGDDLRDGRLMELLPEIAAHTTGIYAVFPPRDYISAAARAFADATETAFA